MGNGLLMLGILMLRQERIRVGSWRVEFGKPRTCRLPALEPEPVPCNFDLLYLAKYLPTRFVRAQSYCTDCSSACVMFHTMYSAVHSSINVESIMQVFRTYLR